MNNKPLQQDMISQKREFYGIASRNLDKFGMQWNFLPSVTTGFFGVLKYFVAFVLVLHQKFKLNITIKNWIEQFSIKVNVIKWIKYND